LFAAQGSLKVNASELEQNASNVRRLATDILAKVETHKAYADVLLDGTLRSLGLSRRDAALLTELIYGTLRWRGRIDAKLNPLMRRGLQSTQPFIRNLLRITLYQLDFLDRIPDYAAVNAAVDLAKAHGRERAAGFVNAVLRRYLKETRKNPPAMPDCERATIPEISDYWSHPQWLVQQWREYLGAAEATALLQANNQEAPLVIRLNPLRTSRDELLEVLRRAGVTAAPARWSPRGITLGPGFAVDQLPGFQEGLFQVQGEASQLVGYLLTPRPGERILDACAAPGGKATHLAELTQDQAEIIATDISRRGLKRLEENAERLGLRSIRSLVADASAADAAAGSFYDCILVDAPCSGLGTLRSHPEIKWHRNQVDIARLTRLQQAILAASAAQLKPGGVLVYSTCTLMPGENEQTVQKFLQTYDKFILEDAADYLPAEAKSMARNGYFMAWPHRHNTDGFFAARLKKAEA
jgi:16S rRNA (cytosine967-C5)-methyltransferase